MNLSAWSIKNPIPAAMLFVLLTLGGRHQTVKMPYTHYSESRFSPMVAAVVRPGGGAVSLFGNYTEGLEPGQVVGTGYSNQGEALAPKVTKQFELGVKLQTGALTHTVSTYQIKRPSFISNNAAPLPTMVDGGKAGKKPASGGSVDSTGSAAANAEVAKQRAAAVAALLKSLGVTVEQMHLQKPEDIQAGSGPQARRVEVTLQ